MKKILLLIILLSVLPLYAQDFNDRPFGPPRERIEELERLKLLEILNLDEETSIRFFSRHSQNKADMQRIIDEKENLIDEMEEAISNNTKNYDYQAKIDKISELEKEMFDSREEFLDSLDDILTKEQIAKVIVFEDRFFREIRNTLIRRGKGGRNN